MLDQTRAAHPEDVHSSQNTHGARGLEVSHHMILADGDVLDLDIRGRQARGYSGEGKSRAVAGHVGRVVDQVARNIAAEGLGDLFVHEEHLAEGLGGRELESSVSDRCGGFGAAEGDEFGGVRRAGGWSCGADVERRSCHEGAAEQEHAPSEDVGAAHGDGVARGEEEQKLCLWCENCLSGDAV